MTQDLEAPAQYDLDSRLARNDYEPTGEGRQLPKKAHLAQSIALASMLTANAAPLYCEMDFIPRMNVIPSIANQSDFRLTEIEEKIQAAISAAIKGDSANETAASRLGKVFDERADRWSQNTAAHSAPGARYFNRDYMAIISKGMENPNEVVPLILKRLQAKGGDWFFALQKITGNDPAKDCEDFGTAVKAWIDWSKTNLPIK